jgi:hypothetical protein
MPVHVFGSRALFLGMDDLLDQTIGRGIPDPYSESETQLFPLGSMLYEPHTGKAWQYAKAGAAIGAGLLCQMELPPADHKAMSVAAPASVGSKQVSITNGNTTTVAKDRFAGGVMHVTDVDGKGHSYSIKSNTAAATGANFLVDLYDPIKVALTTSSKVALARNAFAGVIKHPSPATARLLGVTPIAVTSGYYFWLQTRGPAPVLTDGTLVINEWAVDSSTVDGAVSPAVLTEGTPNTGLGQNFAGMVEVVEADTKYSIVYLTLGAL